MRQLYPVEKSTTRQIIAEDNPYATEEQLDSLRREVGSLEYEVVNDKAALQDYKNNNQRSITTNTLEANTGTFLNVNADRVMADAVNAGGMVTARSARINETLTAPTVYSTNITANTADIDTVSADTVAANNVVSDDITATRKITAPTIEVDNFTTDTFNTNKVETALVDTSVLQANNILGDSANIDTITSEEVETDTLSTKRITVSDYFASRFKGHMERFQRLEILDTDDSYYITLPRFENGSAYLLMTTAPSLEEYDQTKTLWSVEISNSQKNLSFAWSTNSIDDFNTYLQNISVYDPGVRENDYAVIKGKRSRGCYIYYCFDSLNPIPEQYTPVVTTSIDIEPSAHTLNITTQNPSGYYLPNTVFAGKFHADELLIDNTEFDVATIRKQLFLPSQWDSEGNPVATSSGSINDIIQLVNNGQNTATPSYITPSERVVENDKRPITSNGIYNYNGTATDSNDETAYPITELGDETTVHGSARVKEGSLKVDNTFDSLRAHIGDEDTLWEPPQGKSLVVDEGGIYRTTVDEEVHSDPVAAYTEGVVNADGKPLIYKEDTDTVETTDSLTLDDVNVDVLRANEAFINGTLHYVDEETVSSTSDTITLRANNNTSLTPTQVSGIVINKYNGNDDLSLVSDYEGTLRVGTGEGEETTYHDIYYTEGKWYDSNDDEINPEGTLTSWEGKKEEGDVTKYETAVFTEIDTTSLQPLLTRDESADLNNKALFYWDGTALKAKTIPLPIKDKQSLTSSITAQGLSYRWVDEKPTILRFANKAAFNAYSALNTIVPDTIVVIDDETDYLEGEYIDE